MEVGSASPQGQKLQPNFPCGSNDHPCTFPARDEVFLRHDSILAPPNTSLMICRLCGREDERAPFVAEGPRGPVCAECIGLSLRALPREALPYLANGFSAVVMRPLWRDEKEKAGEKIRCSFCGKSKASVERIITGPSVNICTECIALCLEILEDDGVRFTEEWMEKRKRVEQGVIRTVAPPAEERWGGLAVLGLFADFLAERNPEFASAVRVEFEGPTLRLLVAVKQPDADTVRRRLEEFGTWLREAALPGATPLPLPSWVSERTRRILGWILSGEVEDMPELFEEADP